MTCRLQRPGPGRGREAGHGERVARDPPGYPRATGEAADGPAGSPRRGTAGAACRERRSAPHAGVWKCRCLPDHGHPNYAQAQPWRASRPLWWGSQNRHRDPRPGYGRLLHCPGAAQAAITFNGASFPRCYGLVFTSRRRTAPVRSHGLKQEVNTPRCPQQNGLVGRVIRTPAERGIHRPRADRIRHATRAIGDRISFPHHRRPHQAPDRNTPAEASALAAQPVRIPLGGYICPYQNEDTQGFLCDRQRPERTATSNLMRCRVFT